MVIPNSRDTVFPLEHWSHTHRAHIRQWCGRTNVTVVKVRLHSSHVGALTHVFCDWYTSSSPPSFPSSKLSLSADAADAASAPAPPAAGLKSTSFMHLISQCSESSVCGFSAPSAFSSR